MQKKKEMQGNNHCVVPKRKIVGADDPVRPQKEQGITLIALIITIIVMLILVAVSVRVAMDSGIFGHAKDATNRWADAQNKESELGNDIGDIVSKYTPDDGSVDWETAIKNAKKHPDQSAENNDIGIGTDGKPVNLDLWRYTLKEDQTYILAADDYIAGYSYETGYIGGFTETGEIIGKVPQYIVSVETGMALPVTNMSSTFLGTRIGKCPELPETVTEIGAYMFYDCTNLRTVNIPDGLEWIGYSAFAGCTNLNSINLPSDIIGIRNWAFENCVNIKTINIPSGVQNLGYYVFAGWGDGQTINCQAIEKPIGWSSAWNNSCSANVNWGVSM